QALDTVPFFRRPGAYRNAGREGIQHFRRHRSASRACGRQRRCGVMRLYSYFRSSAAYRVRIALALKKLDVELLPVHLLRGGVEQLGPIYRKLNPQALVPTLETEAGALTQSLAVIEYLEETHPEPPLLPRDPLERARVRAFALAIACDIHPLNNLRVLNRL